MMCWLWLMRFASSFASLGGRRQRDGEGRTFARTRAAGRHVAAMHINNPLHDRQPQPGRALTTGGFRRKPLETAEKTAEILRRQSCALVGDVDQRIIAFICDG